MNENSTRKRTGLRFRKVPPSPLRSSARHLSGPAQSPRLIPLLKPPPSTMTPRHSRSLPMSARVFETSSVEYSTPPCPLAGKIFQLKRLENHPLSSPTTGDVSGDFELVLTDVDSAMGDAVGRFWSRERKSRVGATEDGLVVTLLRITYTDAGIFYPSPSCLSQSRHLEDV